MDGGNVRGKLGVPLEQLQFLGAVPSGGLRLAQAFEYLGKIAARPGHVGLHVNRRAIGLDGLLGLAAALGQHAQHQVRPGQIRVNPITAPQFLFGVRVVSQLIQRQAFGRHACQRVGGLDADETHAILQPRRDLLDPFLGG